MSGQADRTRGADLPQVITLVGFVLFIGLVLWGGLQSDPDRLPPLGSEWPLAIGFLLFCGGMMLAIGRRPVQEPKEGKSRRVPPDALIWALYSVAIVIFVAIKYVFIFPDPGMIFADTASYVRVAERSALDPVFWFEERPFTLPLLYRTLGVTLENFDAPGVIGRITRFQGIIAAGSWLLLASTMAQSLRTRWVRPWAFGAVLLFGANLHVSQWDAILISESLSTSLFVTSLALAMTLLMPVAPEGSWWARGKLGLLVFFLVLFAFARDSNMPFLLLGAAGLPLARALRAGSMGRARWVWILSAFIVLILAVLGQARGIEYSDRWKVPFYGVLQDRILVDEAAVEFFHERGMPDAENTEAILGMPRQDLLAAMRKDGEFPELKLWIEESGRATYLAFLLRQPLQTLLTPVRHSDVVVHPLSTEYRNLEAPSPRWIEGLSNLFYPRTSWVLLAAAALSIVATFWLSAARETHPSWWLVMGLAVFSYPMMVLAWYADSVEVERHAFHAAFQLRLSLWMLLLWAADFAMARNLARDR